MPAELFRTVNARRASTARRLGVVPLSVVIHAAVLVAAVTIPLLATDVLPTPHVPSVLRLPSMPVVAVPTVPSVRPPRMRPAIDLGTPPVPLVAPSGITPPRGVEPMAPEIPDVPLGELVGSIDSGKQLGPVPDVVPPPSRKPVAPLPIGGVLERPRKIHDQAPVYPQTAIAAHVEGTVVIEAIISTTGTVQDMRVLHSVPLLDRAALDAVREWRFTPTLLGGVAVPVILTVNVEFRLR